MSHVRQEALQLTPRQAESFFSLNSSKISPCVCVKDRQVDTHLSLQLTWPWLPLSPTHTHIPAHYRCLNQSCHPVSVSSSLLFLPPVTQKRFSSSSPHPASCLLSCLWLHRLILVRRYPFSPDFYPHLHPFSVYSRYFICHWFRPLLLGPESFKMHLSTTVMHPDKMVYNYHNNDCLFFRANCWQR